MLIFLHKTYGFAQIAQKNSAKPRKTHCVSCAKIVQKFTQKICAKLAQKIQSFIGSPRENVCKMINFLLKGSERNIPGQCLDSSHRVHNPSAGDKRHKMVRNYCGTYIQIQGEPKTLEKEDDFWAYICIYRLKMRK